jgi:HD-GYP domain-containing protein (c-di-GMP phosphodiesterase class II)
MEDGEISKLIAMPVQKLKLLRHTAEILTQSCYVQGLDKGRFEDAKEVVGLAVEALMEDGEISKLIAMLNDHGDHLYSHSLGVAVYSSMIAKVIGWTALTTQIKVSMAGLFHDIGLKEISTEIIEKSRKEMNSHELQVYETHATRGKDILSRMPSIPSDVALTALQHHENLIGKKYPTQLKKENIHPLATLVATADRFCDEVLQGPDFSGLPISDVIDRLGMYHSSELEPIHVAALSKLFGLPVPSNIAAKLTSLKKIT